MKKRLERRSLLLLFLLLIFCVAASIQINEKAKKNRLNLKTGSTEEFRKLGMEEAFFQVLAKTDHEKRGRLYAIYFLENSLFPQDNEKELFEKWSEKEEWKSFEKICTALWNDIRYFPVPESPKHPQYQVSFVDSWMGERIFLCFYWINEKLSIHPKHPIVFSLCGFGEFAINITNGTMTNSFPLSFDSNFF